MHIVGLTGHPGAGKDEVADYLATKGFFKFNGGDYIRAEMRAQGLPVDRTSINEYVSKMRSLHGNDYIDEEIVKVLKENTVISAFRNVREVDFFRKKFGKNFVLLAVEAPLEMRFQRILERHREGDAMTFDQFCREEECERQSASGAYEMDKVLAIADERIKNISTKQALFNRVDIFLKQSFGANM